MVRGEEDSPLHDSYKTWKPMTLDELKAYYGVRLLLEMVSKDRIVFGKPTVVTAAYLQCLALQVSDRYYQITKYLTLL